MNKLLAVIALLCVTTVGYAQRPEDAPLVIVSMSTTTPLTGTVSGVTDVLMSMEVFYDHQPGPIVGYVFDASVPVVEDVPTTLYDVIYIFYGSQLNPPPVRICSFEVYEANIEEWTAEEPAYVLGQSDIIYCDGPIPTFADYF